MPELTADYIAQQERENAVLFEGKAAAERRLARECEDRGDFVMAAHHVRMANDHEECAAIAARQVGRVMGAVHA